MSTMGTSIMINGRFSIRLSYSRKAQVDVIIHTTEKFVEMFIDGQRVVRDGLVISPERFQSIINGRPYRITRLLSQVHGTSIEPYYTSIVKRFSDALARGERPPLPHFTSIFEGEYP
jgi:hypothetical protein